MRYVDVNPFFLPYKGGIENRMHDIARLLSSRGHDVTVLTGRLPDTPEEEITEWGYRIVRLPSRLIGRYNPPYISSKGVLETLEGMDADVVNYNYRWAPSYNKDLKRYDGPKTFTYHNMWGEGIGIEHMASEINDDLFRPVLDTFDRIICVSRYVQNDLFRRGIPEERTDYVPPCMELPEVSDVPEEDFVLSFGRLVKTKGIDVLIEAMENVDCRLVVCGKGPEEDRLKHLCAKRGLESRIEFRGYVSETEKADLIDRCMFHVMPSLFESFGLAALESMGRGKPLVFSKVDGLPEVVGNGGLGVEPGDAKGLADAMNAMLDDPGLRQEKSTLARRQAETYTWDRHIGHLEEILEDVARSRTGPS